MSGHVVDRFVHAVWPDFRQYPEENEPMGVGVFRASPEIARMLEEHMTRFGHGDGSIMFGLPVITDPAIPRGSVVFVRRP